MIVLNVMYQCAPGMGKTFLDRIRAEGIDAACRAEDGNLMYDYFFPADGSGNLFLLEKWRDAEALAAHAKQPHFARLGALKEGCVTDTVIEKYVV